MDENIFQEGIDDIKSENKDSLDYDYYSEYDDGDIPEIDKPRSSNATSTFPEEVPKRNRLK